MPRSTPPRTPNAGTAASAPRPPALRLLRDFPVVLGVFAGMAICGVGLVALALLRGGQPQQRHLPSPRPAAEAICAAVEHQDYAALYDMLSSGQRGAGTEAQFAASQRQLDVATGRATSCAASVTLVDGTQAGVTFSVARASGGPMSGSGHLVYESGGWRMDVYDAHVV